MSDRPIPPGQPVRPTPTPRPEEVTTVGETWTSFVAVCNLIVAAAVCVPALVPGALLQWPAWAAPVAWIVGGVVMLVVSGLETHR
jgi:membrane protein YdbS with pleckstrin-like domain